MHFLSGKLVNFGFEHITVGESPGSRVEIARPVGCYAVRAGLIDQWKREGGDVSFCYTQSVEKLAQIVLPTSVQTPAERMAACSIDRPARFRASTMGIRK
jgi:hypothetical protein